MSQSIQINGKNDEDAFGEIKNEVNPSQKSVMQTRLSFLHSLMMREVWLPTEARKDYQTGILIGQCIVFIYDDTLFCSTYISPQPEKGEERVFTHELSMEMLQLEDTVVSFL